MITLIKYIIFLIFFFNCSIPVVNNTDNISNIKNEQEYLLHGKQYYAQNNFRRAITLFNKVLEINWANAEANGYLGGCYYKIGNYNEAIKYLTKAINFGFENPMVYIGLGFSYYNIGDIFNSRIYFEKAIETLPYESEKQQWREFMNKHLK